MPVPVWGRDASAGIGEGDTGPSPVWGGMPVSVPVGAEADAAAGTGIAGGEGIPAPVLTRGGKAVRGLKLLLPQVQEIVFRNFHTAFLSVRVQRPGPTGSRRWVTCLRDYRLMPCPHTEEGSQDYFSLHRHQVGMAGQWPWHHPHLWGSPLFAHTLERLPVPCADATLGPHGASPAPASPSGQQGSPCWPCSALTATTR